MMPLINCVVYRILLLTMRNACEANDYISLEMPAVTSSFWIWFLLYFCTLQSVYNTMLTQGFNSVMKQPAEKWYFIYVIFLMAQCFGLWSLIKVTKTAMKMYKLVRIVIKTLKHLHKQSSESSQNYLCVCVYVRLCVCVSVCVCA